MLIRKSQISIEYLILTGFIFGIIIVSYFAIQSFSSNSTFEALNFKKIDDLGQGIVNNAEELYYLGLYSKKNVVYDIPKNVEKMYILDLNTGTKNIYYFVLQIKDQQNKYFLFFSDVPLMSDYGLSNVNNDGSGSSIPECDINGGPYSCTFYNYIGPVIEQSLIAFKIENKLDNNNVKVEIIPKLS